MHPEETKHTNPLLNKLSTLLFYISILIFMVALAFPHNPAGNWYQQFLPNIGNRTISDIFFIDSLTGWAVTPYSTPNDTSYVLKTTNKGDNWFIQHTRTGQFVGSNRVFFLNANTGYTAGVSNLPTYSAILKTNNGGVNWSNITPPTDPFTARDISILSEDTIWVVSDNSLTGGVFFTSNGGTSWQQQLSGTFNPSKIYMFNARIGFVTNGTNYIRKTTNGGGNWTVTTSGEGFSNMYFTDSLTGWKSGSLQMKKTINGGLNWVAQQLPVGGLISNFGGMLEFSNVNKDTIWGAGGYLFYGSGRNRAIIYKTINGGDNWLFQLPDTGYGIPQFQFADFVNKRVGWAYSSYSQSGNIVSSGVHTTNGGDSIDYLPVTQISSEIPKEYSLFQNYPNPFNPKTKIKASLAPSEGGKQNIKLIVYDITGREVAVLVNEQLSAGIYEVDFNGSNFSSGIYFYSLIIDNKLIDTKKMLMVK